LFQFCQAATFLEAGLERIDIPMPAVLKPTPLWTGKQLYSLLLRPNKSRIVSVNLVFKVR
jgi:DNA-directed RNA polymerase III subunit RPC1